jgi:DNA polymerase III subunit delta
MTVLLFIGEDEYGISQQLAALKRQLDPNWLTFNYHTFSPTQLDEALNAARTPAVADRLKVVVVKDCNFNSVGQFGEQQFELLQCLPHLPPDTNLVFTAASLDKRLKIAKFLLKHGQLKEYPLLPPWRTDLIAQSIAARAKTMKLSLSKPVVTYLALAIGNDSARVASELSKLTVYAQGKSLSQSEVEALVPCYTQTSFQLAEAVRCGDSTRVVQLTHDLLSRAEVPLAIVATLQTQFRTWLWVKSVLKDRVQRKDAEIAQLCGISNSNRLYYLKKDVAAASIKALATAAIWLFELEVELKQGASTKVMLPAFLKVARLFN